MPRHPRLDSIAHSFRPGLVTPAVRVLLWANFVTYFVSLFYSPLTDYLGLVPQQVVARHWIWALATYMFLHARTPTPVLFNMLILWMFGVELERLWRTRFFVKFYMVTGIGAGVISVLASLLPFQPLHQIYAVQIIGASGALYGLLLAYALYFPDRPILMFLFFPVPAQYLVMILGSVCFITSIDGGGAVAATTHLSGLAVGYIYLQGGRGGLTAEIKYRYLKWKM